MDNFVFGKCAHLYMLSGEYCVFSIYTGFYTWKSAQITCFEVALGFSFNRKHFLLESQPRTMGRTLGNVADINLKRNLFQCVSHNLLNFYQKQTNKKIHHKKSFGICA